MFKEQGMLKGAIIFYREEGCLLVGGGVQISFGGGMRRVFLKGKRGLSFETFPGEGSPPTPDH